MIYRPEDGLADHPHNGATCDRTPFDRVRDPGYTYLAQYRQCTG
jgi:hypothetical protein